MTRITDEPDVELYQAEWCPYSHKVRSRLTELGVDFVARQVPVEASDRGRLRAAAGTDSIPVLQAGNRTLCGSTEILEYLDERFEEPPEAQAHRDKAAQEGRD